MLQFFHDQVGPKPRDTFQPPAAPRIFACFVSCFKQFPLRCAWSTVASVHTDSACLMSCAFHTSFSSWSARDTGSFLQSSTTQRCARSISPSEISSGPSFLIPHPLPMSTRCQSVRSTCSSLVSVPQHSICPRHTSMPGVPGLRHLRHKTSTLLILIAKAVSEQIADPACIASTMQVQRGGRGSADCCLRSHFSKRGPDYTCCRSSRKSW